MKLACSKREEKNGQIAYITATVSIGLLATPSERVGTRMSPPHSYAIESIKNISSDREIVNFGISTEEE